MNKKVILTLLLAIFAMVGRAQEIGKAEATPADYIKLLNKQGYHVFALDLSKFDKDKYLMTPVIQKWSNGKMEQNLLKGFPVDFTNSAPKVTIGFMPKTDSLFTCYFQFDDVCGFPYDLPKQQIRSEDGKSNYFDLVPRPFTIQPEWKENVFIPVVACSSWWYDEEDKSYHNCDPDYGPDYLKSNTFTKSPYVYVLGITIRKR